MCDSRSAPWIVILLVLAGTLPLRGQDRSNAPSGSEYEAYLGIGVRGLRAAFAANRDGTLTSSTTCGQFTEGWGRTLLAGLGGRWEIGENFSLGGIIEARMTAAALSYTCVDPASIRLPDGSIVPATTRHVADIGALDLAVRPQLSWQPFAGVPFTVQGGPELWWVAAATHYDVREEIVEPATAEFVSGGGQVQHYAAGDAEDGGRIVPAAALGARYTLPFAREWRWRLGLEGSVAFGSITPGLGLGAAQVALTLGISHTPHTEPSPAIVPVETASPPPVPPAYRLALRAIDSNGTRSTTATVVEERELNTRLHPLLPYLFFDSLSASLPERYRLRTPEEASAFTYLDLRESSTLGIYHNLLDILGERLREYPAAHLTITACQPDQTRTPQSTLAERRADLASSYLRDRWGIAADRMRIQLRQAPATPSNEETPEGAQENRRVEFSSDVAAITAPIIFTDTVIWRTVPAIEVELAGDRPPRSWNLELGGSGMGEQHGATVVVESAEGVLLPAIDAALEARATVSVDGVGEPIEAAPARLQVRRIASNTRMTYGEGTYSLILFDFNSAALRAEHRSILRLVEERYDSTTNASVFGTTDVLGLESHNLELSRSRAMNVARELRGVAVGNVVGQGERSDLYDNALPEGRFYSRSVTIQTRHEAAPKPAPQAPRGTP